MISSAIGINQQSAQVKTDRTICSIWKIYEKNYAIIC